MSTGESDRNHLAEIHARKVSRLRVLELQQASYGRDCPPHIVTEIEEIKSDIKELNTQLQTLALVKATPTEDKPMAISEAALRPDLTVAQRQTRDFVSFCGDVLKTLITASALSPLHRTHGMDVNELALHVFSPAFADWPAPAQGRCIEALRDALQELEEVGGVRQNVEYARWRPTPRGRSYQDNYAIQWLSWFEIPLDKDHATVLQAINRLSHHGDDVVVWLEWFDDHLLRQELAWEDPDLLWAIVWELDEVNLVRRSDDPLTPSLVRARFGGLVWDFRRAWMRPQYIRDGLPDQIPPT